MGAIQRVWCEMFFLSSPRYKAHEEGQLGDEHLQLHRTRRHQKRDWASRGLCEKNRQAPLVASRQSRVVRYPEARSPYRASPAKIALANNFQSDGEEDRAGQRHHHRHHHRRWLGLYLQHYLPPPLLYDHHGYNCRYHHHTKSQAVPTFCRPASFKVMERGIVGGQTRSGHVSELFP